MNICDDTIKQVREVSFTQVLKDQHIPYKKVGREAVTLCPWHNDSKPSLTVNDEKNFCYCFVCQIGCDPIGYLRQKLGIGFAEAIITIAESNNIIVSYENADPVKALEEVKKRKDNAVYIQRQHQVFRENIKHPRASRIRDFLDKRDILPSTSKYFELGYSLDGMFADRITVPIHDHRGGLVGFTGRATKQEAKPKYKNSENNEFFDKSKIIFNEHRALKYASECDGLIFVEGHFDVISLWQHNIRNVVATQGTAPPLETTLRRLSNRTKRFILCYDGDEGGKIATENFINVARSMACKGEISVFVASLPTGKDPEECMKDESVDFYNILEGAMPWIDWQLGNWLEGINKNDSVAFTSAEEKAKGLINQITSPALRYHYIDKVSKYLSDDQKSASKIAKDLIGSTEHIKVKRTWSVPTKDEIRAEAERRMLRYYIHFPDLRNHFREMLDLVQLPIHKWLRDRISDIERHDTRALLPETLMALLLVSEPHYTRQLRPIIVPTIKMSCNDGTLNHITKVIKEEAA